MVHLKNEKFHFDLKSKNLVIAIGGFAGKFQNTDCFRYGDYSAFYILKEKGCKLINMDCLFVHPFGYRKGIRIMTGPEVANGKFIDGAGNILLPEPIRSLVKNNKYHEIFDKVISVMYSNGKEVFFKSNQSLVQMVPSVHYTAGGLKTDLYGGVEGIENLYAIGECRADGDKNDWRLPWISVYFSNS